MKNNYTCCHWAVLIPLLTLFFQLGIVPAYAENPLTQQIISGTISDQKGLPLPGVNVIVKGTSTGTMTNLDGNYSIRASIGDTLLYSYVGYQTLEKELRPEFIGDLIMQPATDALSEVVINAGYYNTTERERTGNIARVSGEDIQLQPVVNPLQALQGRMAGVEITPGGSHPGMAATIRIRGTNSLRQEGNYPLYIIDGVPVNPTPIESSSLMSSTGIDPLNNLDINNIKSIEILKDADATAIYGSRGANGVILITTKIGYNQGTSLDVRLYHGGTTAPQRYDLLNTQQYLAVRKKAFENDGIEPTERNAYDLLLWEQDRYTDWQDFLFGGTAETTNANLNFSGGNNTTSFRFGTSYFSQGTIYPGDYNYHKITGNLNLNHRSENQKFNLNLSLNYGVDTNKMVGNVGFNSTTAILPPNAPEIFNEDGSLAWELWERANLDNPLKGYFNESNTQTNNLISNISLSYEVIQGLQLKANMGYTYYDAGELRKQPKRSYNPADENIHSSSHYKTNRTSWIIEPQLIYNTNINQLTIEALLGTTFQENKDQMENFQGRGYASEALIGNLAAAESIVNARTENNDYRYSAIFSRLGFHWDKKYFLNLTGRRDGSSRFGPSNRFANFGAIGLAW
uniref:SusC/RagA family TonB-linked outer membrane protein n=1 Tax=Zunongwangia profunda TaxID=398743 RepID=UPI0030D91984